MDLRPGLLAVTETDGSTCAVAWTPLADVAPSTLSPAAVDALRMIEGAHRAAPAGRGRSW
ncbi:hypothetical protein ABT236_10040 [Streptomyces sp. NPDC001523]|uniref:hypothetical protein n=1 Tax=Streptomyces sp. NPDC001523 TaxID=3154383 RepID=UPI00332A10F9